MNVSEELTRLAQLRDQGVLTQEEFDAQKAAVLAGDRPATPAATTPGKGKSKLGVGCLAVVVIIVVLAVIGAIAGGGGKTSSASDQQAAVAVEPVKVTASDLFNAYQANEAAAQQTYGSQPLLVTGKVASIDLDLTDKPVVHLSTPNQFMSAAANLTEASQAKASGLRKGQSIAVLCGGVSEVMSIPQLKDCEIQ